MICSTVRKNSKSLVISGQWILRALQKSSRLPEAKREERNYSWIPPHLGRAYSQYSHRMDRHSKQTVWNRKESESFYAKWSEFILQIALSPYRKLWGPMNQDSSWKIWQPFHHNTKNLFRKFGQLGQFGRYFWWKRGKQFRVVSPWKKDIYRILTLPANFLLIKAVTVSTRL